MSKIKVQLIDSDGTSIRLNVEAHKVGNAHLVQYKDRTYSYHSIKGSSEGTLAVFREVNLSSVVVSLTDEELVK